MTVYVDVLLATHLYLTFLLLTATERLARTRYGRLRRLLASLLGAVSSLTLLLPGLPEGVWLLIRAGLAAVIVWVASGEKRLRPFLFQTLLFFVASLILAGGTLLLSLWDPAFFAVSGGVIYLDIDVWMLLSATTLAYLVLWLIGRLRSRRGTADPLRVTVTIGERQVALNAIVDTGNSLREPFSGVPVAVVRFGAVGRMLPKPLSENVPALLSGVPLESLPPIPDLRLIPARTVRGPSLLPAGGPYLFAKAGGKPVQMYLAFCPDAALPHFDLLLPENSLE